MEDVITKFIQDLIIKAGIDKMPDKAKQDYTARLVAIVQKKLGIMALDSLDEEGLKKFEEFTSVNESPNSKELLEFFNTYIPNFIDKVNQALQQFADEFLQGAADLKDIK